MSISFNKYVKIVSGVIGANAVRRRDLIGRIFTDFALLSPNSVLEFTSADDVKTFFGNGSFESNFANMYFGYIAPNITAAKRISFARYSPNAVVASIYSNATTKSLPAIKLVVAGVMSLKVGAVTVPVNAINFGAAVSLAAVATTLQAALIATGNADLANATVTYDAVSARFRIQMGAAFRGKVTALPAGVGITDTSAALGLYESAGGIDIEGTDAQTPVTALQQSIQVSNNFGSFGYSTNLNTVEKIAVASYNATRNVEFMGLFSSFAEFAVADSAALLGFAGTGLTLVNDLADMSYLFPMVILAATDYNKRNSVQNYMYRQSGNLAPSVSDDTNYELYKGLRVNFYGNTSSAGQKINFYQHGVLMGTATAPTGMGPYANEMWLKDYAGSQILSLQLNVGNLPANISGRAQILNILQPVINDALDNGVISVGKTLNAQQQVAITDMTGDPLAWIAVQNIGYVIDVQIRSEVDITGVTTYYADYTLIYSKNDAILRVQGTHALV